MSATYLDNPEMTEEEKPLSFMEPLSSTLDVDGITIMEDIDEAIEEIPKIKLGICAMNKKVKM